jgi:putative acyl-CoA dehydrogenase
MAGLPRSDTDDVTNQPPPFQDVDLFDTDMALQAAVGANGGGGEAASL